MAEALLRTLKLTKKYPAPQPDAPDLVLFEDLNLEVAAGEMVAIAGESGSGKSTLLHLLASLDRPSSGEVWCNGVLLNGLDKTAAADFRNRQIGYVWQAHYLLPEFTAIENVAMPLLARGLRRDTALTAARLWLGEVRLGDRATHRAGELSGGEQQRVSLARALVGEPRLLLADEPTGNLDERTAESIFQLMRGLHATHNLTSVLVTHSLDFGGRCDRLLRLHGGRLAEMVRRD